jgi:hypothetical protein
VERGHRGQGSSRAASELVSGAVHGWPPLVYAMPGRLDVMTAGRRLRVMDETKRATIYFDAEVHEALRLKAAATDRSMSEMVNETVRMLVAEDAVDLAAAGQRAL